MNEHERLSLGYRQKAVELRAMISDFKDEMTRGILEKVAAQYDHLASIQEKLAKQDVALSKL